MAAPVLVRTTDGRTLEGEANLRSITVGAKAIPLARILSVHSAAPATAGEAALIKAGIEAIQGADRKARDKAVLDLTMLGLPVLTPLLDTYKDTDQHEPRPLYRLFERIMPSHADGFDRSLSLIRLTGGETVRGAIPSSGAISVRGAGGETVTVPWIEVRSLAVRQKQVTRDVDVHSLRHSTQIEYLDSGVELTAASKLNLTAAGFARLSWNADGWASDANGLTKPGSPAYKSHLFDGQPFGALVGRIGADGGVFFLGKSAAKSGLTPGRLTLAVNDNRHWQNNLGSYRVHLTAGEAYDWGEAQ